MIAKIVSGHGTGSAAPAIHYIAGENNHKGIKRDEVIHLFGDGQQLINLTESLTCKHTYLSSILSFTKEESARLSVDAIRQLAESFAAHHAGPMGVHAIAGCAYLHVEDGRYDAHLVQVQLDMQTGKRVDLYLDNCGDTQRIADWQDCKNYEMKLDDPRDPSRMRLTNDRIREAPNRAAMRQLVNQHLLQRTIDGALTNRAGVLRELKLLGFGIERQTEKNISISSPDLKQNIRLTGSLFNESFAGIDGIEAAIADGQRRSAEDYRAQYESTRTRLAKSNEKRTERISKKLKINFDIRTTRLSESDPPEKMADLDSIARELPTTRRNRLVGHPDNQHLNEGQHDDGISNKLISRKELRDCPKRQCDAGQEWQQLLDQTQLKGAIHETTDHKISDYRPHVARTKRHSETMRRLSACGQRIKHASEQISSSSAAGESTFDNARRRLGATIERFAAYIESMAISIRESIFQSPPVEAEHVVQNTDSEGIGMK